MRYEFDVVVVGTGSAGSSAAQACRKAGLSVAIADKRPFGGTCALRGCDPKKVLVDAAAVIERAERMKTLGIGGNAHIEWDQLMRFKRTFTDPEPEAREKRFKDAGMTTAHGEARFIDPDSLAIGADLYAFKHAVLATGAIPRTLGIAGEEHVVTSEGFLDLERMPHRIVFIGGGYVSFEFAHVARRAGAAVTILQHGPRPLARFDTDLVDRLIASSKAIGIDVILNSNVTGVRADEEAFRVSAEENGVSREYVTDLVVHGAGRAPDIGGLQIDRANVAGDPKNGIALNEYFQSTTNPAVYAAGDCAHNGGLPLTPVAGLEGDIVATNIIGGNTARADFTGLVSIVYTLPSLAAVGLNEDQARRNGITATTRTGDSTQWFSSRHTNAAVAGYKILIDENDHVIGAHFLGTHAEELANVFALVQRANITASVLKNTLFGWPTPSSDIESMLEG
ncbi:MAG TPA: NAD(P)/FAD-dependent oxidoreductase [Candidatus Baltobacteraceae bacterium]|nr:NAD(P)/FAD-dependent oxidoreductase [Candidatus Baltobacteraceae bacterium]